MYRTFAIGEDKVMSYISDNLKYNLPNRSVEVYPKKIDGSYGRRAKKRICTDEKGIYFVWNKQRVYVEDYEYRTVDQLIEAIKNGERLVTDDFLATLYRDFDNFGVIAPLHTWDMKIPMMGIGLTGDNTVDVLCDFDEGRYRREDWHYKVTLVAHDEEMKDVCASRNFYFSDFCSLVQSGHIQIVNKPQWLAERKRKAEEKAREDAKFINKVKKFFGLYK